jgi:hypothetical protein
LVKEKHKERVPISLSDKERRERDLEMEKIAVFSGHFDCCLQQKEEEKTLVNLLSKISKIYFFVYHGEDSWVHPK